ncbi:MAG: hypothetical protein KatS3mg129_0722 [Leptospiraceae bacterium]|nr:MAG: hypothetical protein KatS3mg129_0722 [Leptospiraceae bacterium]
MIFYIKNSLIAKEKKRVYTFVYEIYDIRFCHLTPDPFLCKKCLLNDMQIGRKIIFKENEIIRINTCIPYKRKYLW